MTEWFDIEEVLPENKQACIVIWTTKSKEKWQPDFRGVDIFNYSDGTIYPKGFVNYCIYEDAVQEIKAIPLYWMPLPEFDVELIGSRPNHLGKKWSEEKRKETQEFHKKTMSSERYEKVYGNY